MTRDVERSTATVVRDGHVRRRRLERWWLALVLVWSALRIAAVWRWLEQYGVDPVVYAAVDLGSSVPYAIASARTMGALVDRRHRPAARWGAVAAVCFLAPDVYIVAAGKQMPWVVYAIVVTVVSVAGGLALRTGRNDLAERTGGVTR